MLNLQFYNKHLDELKRRVTNAEKREDFLYISEWINKKAPKELLCLEGQRGCYCNQGSELTYQFATHHQKARQLANGALTYP